MTTIRGVTLLELLVVLVVLGILAAVAPLTTSPRAARLPAPCAAARAAALRAAVPVQYTGRTTNTPCGNDQILFMPDGRVVGGPFDHVTGELLAP